MLYTTKSESVAGLGQVTLWTLLTEQHTGNAATMTHPSRKRTLTYLLLNFLR